MLLQVTLETSKICIFETLIQLDLQLGLCENQNLQITIRCDELFYKVLFGREVFAQNNFIADCVWHLDSILTNQIQHHGIAHIPSGNLLNILWHSSRKYHGLCIWHKPLNADDVLMEAHVKHFVTLVQNLVLRAFYV